MSTAVNYEGCGNLVVAGSALAAGIGFLTFMSSIDRSPAIEGYNQHLIGEKSGDDCLVGSPYDESQGAIVRPNHDEGNRISIRPSITAANLPTLHLLFSAQMYEDGQTVYFIPQDPGTASKLNDYRCPLPRGA